MLSKPLVALATGLAMSFAAMLPARVTQAGPALLLEAESGRVLYAEDADHKWFPASVTKILTAYVVLDEIKAGRLKADDMVTVSEHAHAQVPSKLGLPVGEQIPVDLAIRVLIVKSANDVAVMLAERVSGSEEAFVARMNATAQRLGMSRSRFVNPHGLPAAGQVSTARDLARLARAVISDFPEHRALWTLSEVQVGKIRLKSHNLLLRDFEGADGLKTGFICDSGFNMIATATRNGQRLIAVVLGEPSGVDRNIRAAALLDHGFIAAPWRAQQRMPALDAMPFDTAAREVQSVRASVVAWDCGNRKPAKRLARRKKPAATARKAVKPAAKAPAAPTQAQAPVAAPAAKN
jgi:D-alanyl-D-alanine carboxypeptidase